MYMCVRRAGGRLGGGGTERDPPCMVCVAPFPGLYYEWWPLWCCSEAGGRKKEERGGVAPSPRAHRIHFSQRAGCWREGTRERERERVREGERRAERERERERARVCVRVSCVCAWIAPPHPVHRFCRRPCSDGENKSDNAFFSLRCPHRRVIPDVTDKSFYVASCFESCAVHLGETVTPWLWLWNL